VLRKVFIQELDIIKPFKGFNNRHGINLKLPVFLTHRFIIELLQGVFAQYNPHKVVNNF
jgi:hypothetical protein